MYYNLVPVYCLLFQTNISMVLRYSVQIIGSVAVMLWLSAPLTAVLLAVIPVVAIGAAQYGESINCALKFQSVLEPRVLLKISLFGLRLALKPTYSIFRAPFSIRKYIFEPTPKRQKYLPKIRWYFCDLPRLIIFIYRPLLIFRIPCFHCLSVVLNIKICRICPLLENCLLFFVEKFFKKENILFSWVFFLFLILPMTRRLRVCRIVGLLYYTYVWGVTAVRKPEVAGSSPGVGHILYTLLEIRQHIIIFY